MRRLTSKLRRFRKDEDGSATIEFCILFPAFLAIMLVSIESGFMMVRNVMLERGVDIAVRDLRLGTGATTFDAFKQNVCDNALIVQDCFDRIQLELQPVQTDTWALPPTGPRCVDVQSDIEPVDQTVFLGGGNNDLMLIRVCALFDPFFGASALAMRMPTDGNGNYALVVSSAFVNEPSR